MKMYIHFPKYLNITNVSFPFLSQKYILFGYQYSCNNVLIIYCDSEGKFSSYRWGNQDPERGISHSWEVAEPGFTQALWLQNPHCLPGYVRNGWWWVTNKECPTLNVHPPIIIPGLLVKSLWSRSSVQCCALQSKPPLGCLWRCCKPRGAAGPSLNSCTLGHCQYSFVLTDKDMVLDEAPYVFVNHLCSWFQLFPSSRMTIKYPSLLFVFMAIICIITTGSGLWVRLKLLECCDNIFSSMLLDLI